MVADVRRPVSRYGVGIAVPVGLFLYDTWTPPRVTLAALRDAGGGGARGVAGVKRRVSVQMLARLNARVGSRYTGPRRAVKCSPSPKKHFSCRRRQSNWLQNEFGWVKKFEILGALLPRVIQSMPVYASSRSRLLLLTGLINAPTYCNTTFVINRGTCQWRSSLQ